MPRPTASRILKLITQCREAEDFKRECQFDQFARKQAGGRWHRQFQSLGEVDWKLRTPAIPFLEAMRTWMPHVVGDGLQPTVSPGGGFGSRADTDVLQWRLRQWADKSGYAAEHEDGVCDSMCGRGFWYIGRRDGSYLSVADGESIDPGEPIVKRIALGNMIVDPNADSLRLGVIVGHRCDLDRVGLLEAGIGNRSIIEKLPNTWELEEDGIPCATQRRSRGNVDEDSFLTDEISVFEVTFRQDGRWMRGTLPPTSGEEEWIVEPFPLDSDDIPYVELALNRISGTNVPISPAVALMDAHLAVQACANKVGREVETLRRRGIVTKDAMGREMAAKINANGDDLVLYGDPSKYKEAIFGGMTEEAARAYLFFQQIGFSVGPNVQMLGGKMDPGNSATASQLLAGNGAMQMQYWTNRAKTEAGNVLRRVASMLDDDVIVEFPLRLPDGRVVGIPFVPNARDISLDSFIYDIKVASPLPQDPRSRQRSFAEMFGVLVQFVPMIVQMGGEIDVAMRVIEDVWGHPELSEMLPNVNDANVKQRLLQMYQNQSSRMGRGQINLGAPRESMSAQMQSDYSRGVPA